MKRLCLMLMLAAALPARAVEYKAVQTEKSSLSFGYRQMGVAMDGRFSRFQAQLAFDPARPGAARVSLEVDLASIDVGSDEGNGEVAGKPWFHTKAFPVARFVADSVKPLGGNRYEVKGKLTIKGLTREVTAPASFTPQAGAAAFDGAFHIRRADFAIGDGVWADFSTVANEISIKFHILATAGK